MTERRTLGLAWNNHLLGATLATNSEVPSLPLAHIREVLGATIWRTTQAESIEVLADLGGSQPIRALAIACATLTAGAAWRLRLSSSDAHAGDLYDSDVVPMGVPPAAGQRGQAAMLLPAAVSARYARIDFGDSGRAGQGFIDIGHLWLSDLWQPSRNFSYGAQSLLVDGSQATTSIGGQDYVDVRPKFRAERLELNFLDEGEALDDIAAMDAVAGTSGNVLLLPDPGGIRQNQKMLIGRQTEIGATENTRHGVHARAFEIKERI